MAYGVINEQEAFITTFIFSLCFTNLFCQTPKSSAEPLSPGAAVLSDRKGQPLSRASVSPSLGLSFPHLGDALPRGKAIRENILSTLKCVCLFSS